MPCPNCPPGSGESASLGEKGIERRCLVCRSLVTDDAPVASVPVEFPAWSEPPRAAVKSHAAKPVAPTDILGAAKARLVELEAVIRAADNAAAEANQLRQVIAILEPASEAHPFLRAVGDT